LLTLLPTVAAEPPAPATPTPVDIIIDNDKGIVMPVKKHAGEIARVAGPVIEPIILPPESTPTEPRILLGSSGPGIAIVNGPNGLPNLSGGGLTGGPTPSNLPLIADSGTGVNPLTVTANFQSSATPITKLGNGTFILNGLTANTFTGNSTVGAGVIQTTSSATVGTLSLGGQLSLAGAVANGVVIQQAPTSTPGNP
jgi:autotransporter-associated beta strand protein